MIRSIVLVTLSALALCFGLAEARLGVFAPRLLEAIDWAGNSANKEVIASGPSILESLRAGALLVNVDVASPPPIGEGIVSIWLAKVAASVKQQAAKNSVVPNAGVNGRNLAMAPQPSQDVWSNVCSTCSKAQVESCLLGVALDEPSRTYDPSAAVLHAADTYDCLVNTDGCCTATDADGGAQEAKP
jgi:hypothetical protein